VIGTNAASEDLGDANGSCRPGGVATLPSVVWLPVACTVKTSLGGCLSAALYAFESLSCAAVGAAMVGVATTGAAELESELEDLSTFGSSTTSTITSRRQRPPIMKTCRRSFAARCCALALVRLAVVDVISRSGPQPLPSRCQSELPRHGAAAW
jgi:hypothetical protein